MLSGFVGVLALMVVSLLFAWSGLLRRGRMKIHAMPQDLDDLSLDKSRGEGVDSREAEVFRREVAAAAKEQKINDLGARLLERALPQSPTNAQARRDWANQYDDITAETVLEKALQRLDRQLETEANLVRELADLHKRLQAQAADAAATSSRMQDLQTQLAEVQRSRAQEREKLVALETQAEVMRRLADRRPREATRAQSPSDALVADYLARRALEEERYAEAARRHQEEFARAAERLQVFDWYDWDRAAWGSPGRPRAAWGRPWTPQPYGGGAARPEVGRGAPARPTRGSARPLSAPRQRAPPPRLPARSASLGPLWRGSWS